MISDDDRMRRIDELRCEAAELRAHARLLAWVTGSCAVPVIVGFLVPPLMVICSLTAVATALITVVLSLRWRRP